MHRTLISPHLIDKKTLPDGVQHARGDAPPPGQTEHPDSADATERRLRDGSAAPSSVPLHEIVLCHVFLNIWLLQDSVSLERGKGKPQTSRSEKC